MILSKSILSYISGREYMKIKRQIQLISFFSCLFPILVIFLFSSNTLEKEIKLAEGEKLEAIFVNVENDLIRTFKELNIYLDILNDINATEDKEMLIKHMTDFSSQSSQIIYFAYGNEKGEFYLEDWVEDNFPENYDPRMRPWYRGAMNQGEGIYISNVYTHAATGKKIVTASLESRDKEGNDGALAVLINLEDLSNKLEEFRLEKTGRFIVVDVKGNVVLGNGDEHFKKVNFLDVLNRRSMLYELEGRKYYIFDEALEQLNLTLIGIIPHDEVLHVLFKIRKLFLVITCVTLVVALFFISILINKLVESLSRIAYIIDNIARGNYTKNVKKLTRLIDNRSELYLVKDGINRMQSEIEKREKKLKLIAETDALTNIYNRGAIMKLLELEVKRSTEFETDFSLIMFDLDKFKVLNDNYGHQFGDEVLKKVACNIKKELKRRDLFGRYGGEEFLIILPDTKLEEGVVVANRLRRKIESLAWKFDIVVTISLGVEEFRMGYDDDSILSSVDRLLYKAKENGRNRVEYK